MDPITGPKAGPTPLLKDTGSTEKAAPTAAPAADLPAEKPQGWQANAARTGVVDGAARNRDGFASGAAAKSDASVALNTSPGPKALSAKHDLVHIVGSMGKGIFHVAEKVVGAGHSSAPAEAIPPPPPMATPRPIPTPQIGGPLLPVPGPNLGALPPKPPPQHTITLAWTPSTSPGITQQEIHFGKSSGNYTQTIVIPASDTTYKITGLPPGTYYFAVTAFEGTVQSGDSNEAKAVVP